MNLGYSDLHGCRPTAKTTILLLLSVVFFFCAVSDAHAQKRFSRSYPAGKDVRLQLTNRSGTITVEGWDRAEVSITAYLETPAAAIEPQNIEGTIHIDLVKANKGRPDVGSVNFLIRVPYYSIVDIETRIGNLNVSNIGGGLVRAHVSSEGDITLTNIGSIAVSAENGIGNIFFDGVLRSGGRYRFASMSGEINIRIPLNSNFRVVATAPSTRNINFGAFRNADSRIIGDGRRMVGQSGDGSATLEVVNQRGSIGFIRR